MSTCGYNTNNTQLTIQWRHCLLCIIFQNCRDAFSDFVQENLLIIAIIGIVFAVFEVSNDECDHMIYFVEIVFTAGDEFCAVHGN